MKILFLFYLLIFIFIFGSCTCNSRFHKLAVDKDSRILKNDGVILGIEKYKHSCVKHNKGIDSKRYKITEKNSKKSKKLKEFKEFKELISKEKVMLISHIIGFNNSKRKDIYNPFKDNKKPDYDIGYLELDKFSLELESTLIKGNYTHLILFSMGWNNGEFESIDRYNLIVNNIKKAYKSEKFKPYIIGITWPSNWKTPGVSFANKANDADEIGFTILNYILHNVILKTVKNIKNIKTVAVGHSLGARIISRAIFSRKYLKDDKSNGKQLDLFIGLQPAFSVYRFLECEGNEGSPYMLHKNFNTKFLSTSSKCDKANIISKWSKYLGGKRSFPIVKDNTDDFNFYKSELMDFDTLWNSPKKIEFVDSSFFIKDHNDILDDEMGVFLFKVINSLNKLEKNKKNEEPKKITKSDIVKGNKISKDQEIISEPVLNSIKNNELDDNLKVK